MLPLIFQCLALSSVFVGIVSFTIVYVRKSMVCSNVQLQCSPADAEGMVISLQFYEGESDASKKKKVSEAYALVDARREDIHLKMLQIRAEAQAENEAKVAAGEEMKLRSISEAKTT